MRLTVFTDYTLRVLIYLGMRRDHLATIGEIATAYGISRNHLMKVVHRLVSEGYVESVRGKGGGIRLKQAPEEVRVGAVVRATEQESQLVECFDPESSDCRIQSACVLQGVLHQALDAFYRELDRYTLADLLRPEKRLEPLLFTPGARPVRS